MLTSDVDFRCGQRNNVFVCTPGNQTAFAVYKSLQERVKMIGTTLARVNPSVPQSLTTLGVDGRIGPTTALGVQFVLIALNRLEPLPPDLSPLLNTQVTADEVIRRVATYADGVLRYVEAVLAKYENAVPTLPPVRKSSWRPTWLTKHFALGVGGAAAGVVLLGIIAMKMNRRQSGQESGERFLPAGVADGDDESEGSDPEDESDDGDGEQ